MEESNLDLHTGFLIVQEMLTDWPQFVYYITSTAQQQEYQLVHGRVGSWSLILWCDLEFLFIVLSLYLLLGQAFDAQFFGGDLFESRLELFKVILQDYREAFRRCCVMRRDQGFSLSGQMLDFLHRLLRRIISRESLPEESQWGALLGFEFIDAQLLSISQFLEKTEFRTKAMKAAKGRINVEKEKNKKSKIDLTASAVIGDIFNPHVNQGRAYIHYVCT